MSETMEERSARSRKFVEASLPSSGPRAGSRSAGQSGGTSASSVRMQDGVPSVRAVHLSVMKTACQSRFRSARSGAGRDQDVES